MNLDIENPLRYRANSGEFFLLPPQQEVTSALYDAGARTYNTGTGRWLQEDPFVGISGDPMTTSGLPITGRMYTTNGDIMPRR
jgi:hypothetical protein